MKRFVSYLLLLLCWTVFVATSMQVHAQGISPIIQEFNKKARGTIQVANLSNVPKLVSCKAQGFEPDEHGSLQFHPLDEALFVRINSSREVVPANSSRQISFDATPAALPAWFAVTCRLTPLERSPGLTIALELSSIVIINGGHVDLHDLALSARHVGGKVEVEIKNNGSGLAHVNSSEVLGPNNHTDIGTFLLFPQQKRKVEIDWKFGAASPETVRIQIGKIKLEAPVN